MSDTSTDRLRWALALATSKDPQGVAEAHGLVTGLVTGQPTMDASELWLHWLSLNLHGETEESQQALLADALDSVRADLGAEDMSFEILMPSMDQPLAQKTQGLAGWCSGFLAGFGASGGRLADEEANEALTMIAEIARADIETDASSPSDELESEEQALAELVEFVKVAVLLLHEARRLANSSSSQAVEQEV